MKHFSKQLFHFLKENNALLVSAIFTILLLCCMGGTTAFADNVMTSGTKLNVLSVNFSASVNDPVIKSGATLAPIITYALANTVIHQLSADEITSFGTYSGSQQQSAVSLTGPTKVCVNSKGNVYTTDPGQIDYAWGVSTGGTITAGGTATDNTVTITWNTADPQTVNVNYDGSSEPTNLDVTVNPLPVPTINGPSSSCVGTTGVTYFTEQGMTGYSWTISPGGTITIGLSSQDYSVTVKWISTGTQTVSVNYINNNGCTASTATVYNVIVNPLPVPTITGPASSCVGKTGVNYSTESGMTGYIWTISAGGTITAGVETSSVTMTWNTTGPKTVSVNYTNSNNCTSPTATTYNVIVNPLPVPTITGLSSVCVGTTGVTYTTEEGMTGYTWAISPGGTITSGAGTKTITVTWNTTGAQNVSVNYTNSNNCTASIATVYNIAVNPLPVPTIKGLSSVCNGTTGVTYTTESGMTGYTWTISAGGTITSWIGTKTITVTWNTTGEQNVSVNYTNNHNCTSSNATVYYVTVNPLPVPTITGPASLCVGTTGVTYSTETGMTGYTWTISAGGTITEGDRTNTITVTWNTNGAQNVSVNYTNINSCHASTATVYNITVNPLPVPTIAGPSSVCIGTTSVNYATETGMTGYTWTISAGGIITAGTGTKSITVIWNTTGAQNVSINYANSNNCTASTATVYNVTVNPLPPVPTITGPAFLCSGTTGVTYTTEKGMTGYFWTISPGGTITDGAETNTITVTWNTAGSNFVNVNYQNSNGCFVPSATRLVYVSALPVPIIKGPESVNVNTTCLYNTASGMTNYTWTVSSGGSITSGGDTKDSWVKILWLVTGSQTVSVNYTNSDGCSASTPTKLTIRVNPLKMSPGFDPITNNGIDITNDLNETLNNDQLPEFSVYPVPNDGRFTISIISLKKENYTINIFNYLGVEVYNLKNLTVDGIHKQQVDISSVTEGIYMVIIRNADNQKSMRILIRK
jgi:small neutral amino acid transporter SnatA (MarC family)